ncbi:MAG: ABC transporter permease subunit [Bdellovibrionales bacterium]|nr:ABC transporter permease subunit [Bdellovibrionales bacterium]
MGTYILRRILLMIPTLFGITLLCFVIINLAPGSPIDQKLQQMRMGGAMAGGGPGGAGGGMNARTESGVSEEVMEALKKQYGFDKPMHERYVIWIKNVVQLDFGRSFKYEEPVTDVIFSKMPVSLTFGITSLILSYLVCIPLGVIKALKQGSKFDAVSSFVLFVMYSIPALILGILLRTFLSSGNYLDWFPLANVYSDNYMELDTMGQIWDRIHHAILPMACYMVGSFTFLTIMMQNSMLDVVKLDYVRTARAKGLAEKTVYLKHALRNALIPIVTGMSGILSIMFSGSIIIESIFSLDGMGLLALTSSNARDYNVLMGLIFFQSILFLFGRLLTDLLYVVVDPRIDFT